MSQVWTIKLNESKNTCYVSDTIACTIKANVSWEMIVFANAFVLTGPQSENKRSIK